MSRQRTFIVLVFRQVRALLVRWNIEVLLHLPRSLQPSGYIRDTRSFVFLDCALSAIASTFMARGEDLSEHISRSDRPINHVERNSPHSPAMRRGQAGALCFDIFWYEAKDQAFDWDSPNSNVPLMTTSCFVMLNSNRYRRVFCFTCLRNEVWMTREWFSRWWLKYAWSWSNYIH